MISWSEPYPTEPISSIHRHSGPLCQEIGCMVNIDKSELGPKEVVNFVGYQFDLREGKVKLNVEHWQTLNLKIKKLLTNPISRV